MTDQSPDISLSEIFDLDPLSLTLDDPRLERAIAAYREKRHLFNLGNMQAGKVKPKASAALTKAGLDLSADADFDLKI